MRFSMLWDFAVRWLEACDWTLDIHWELAVEFTRRSLGGGP